MYLEISLGQKTADMIPVAAGSSDSKPKQEDSILYLPQNDLDETAPPGERTPPYYTTYRTRWEIAQAATDSEETRASRAGEIPKSKPAMMAGCSVGRGSHD